MKAYIAVSYSQREMLKDVLEAMVATLQENKIEVLVFAAAYSFTAAQEKEMMQQAMAAIDACDLLIAETSCKAIGVGLEAGYAKAKQKPVIYMRQQQAAHSTTVSGISDIAIIYSNTRQLQEMLTDALLQLNLLPGKK